MGKSGHRPVLPNHAECPRQAWLRRDVEIGTRSILRISECQEVGDRKNPYNLENLQKVISNFAANEAH